MAESQEDLQAQLNVFGEYCQKWKLKVNVEKTNILIFSRGRPLLYCNYNFCLKVFRDISFTISISDPFDEKRISTRGRPLEKIKIFVFSTFTFNFHFWQYSPKTFN
jgi:hypothetical protein